MPHEIVWTRQARTCVRFEHSSRRQLPQLRLPSLSGGCAATVERLRMLPLSGHVVPQLGREDMRELLKGNYRVIYRAAEHRVEILTIYRRAACWTNPTCDAECVANPHTVPLSCSSQPRLPNLVVGLHSLASWSHPTVSDTPRRRVQHARRFLSLLLLAMPSREDLRRHSRLPIPRCRCGGVEGWEGESTG